MARKPEFLSELKTSEFNRLLDEREMHDLREADENRILGRLFITGGVSLTAGIIGAVAMSPVAIFLIPAVVCGYYFTKHHKAWQTHNTAVRELDQKLDALEKEADGRGQGRLPERGFSKVAGTGAAFNALAERVAELEDKVAALEGNKSRRNRLG